MALSKCGIEVYVTESLEEKSEDTKNDSKTNVQAKAKELAEKANSTSSTSSEDSEKTEEESTSSFNSDLPFMLQNGATTHIDYIGEVYTDSYESDYTEMTSSVTVGVPNSYLNLFFKGKKSCFKKGVQDGTLKWEDMKNVTLGFVTELTWNDWKIDVKISGMDKLLDKQETFDISQTKRSEVIKQIIEAAGLKAKVDTTGLKDDVIDFKTATESNDEDGEGYSGEVSGDIAEAAKQICQGKTTCLSKIKAIWKWCHDEMKYVGYSNSQRGAEGCFKQRGGNCCDHAHVVVQMCKAVGVKAAYEHSGSCYSGKGHVWAVAWCDGTMYRIDASVKSVGFNQVGQGCRGTIKESLGF